MAQEILNGRQIGISVEKLCGHGVPKPMTRDAEMILSGIVLDPLLDRKSVV